MSEAAAKASLAKVSNNMPNCVVAVDGGYEGATSEEKTMTFWRTDASGKWVKDGQASSMPGVSFGVDENIETSIDGKKLPGASHAIFILHRFFGGTGSSPKLQVFAKDGSQWGAITSDDDSHLRVDTGLHNWDATVAAWSDAKFESGLLKLASFVGPNGTATGWDEWQGWRAQGDSFVRVGEPERPANAYDYGSSYARFASPSGQILCQVSDRMAKCIGLVEAVGKPEYDGGVQLTSEGTQFASGELGVEDPLTDDSSTWAKDARVTPPMKDGNYVLPYGKSFSDDYVKCTMKPSGVTCSNDVASFTMSTHSLTRTGKRLD